MVHGTHITHHMHKRRRAEEKPKKLFILLDKAVYVAGFLGLIMTVPQILKIWVEQNASGISVISWCSYLLISIVWITYGWVHKERPLIVIYACWVLFYVLIIVGALLYGAGW